MKIALHTQSTRKLFFDVTVNDNITISELACKCSSDSRHSGVTVIWMDIPLIGREYESKTLKECGIKDGDHIYLHDGPLDKYNEDGGGGLCKIFIKDLSGKIYPIEIDLVKSVRALAKQVATLLNIDTTKSKIQFYFAGKILDEHRTLQNSSISNDTTITMILRTIT